MKAVTGQVNPINATPPTANESDVAAACVRDGSMAVADRR